MTTQFALQSKLTISAHQNPINCIAVNSTGTLLATTSEQGTLIRVFNTKTGDKLAEFRRGTVATKIHDL